VVTAGLVLIVVASSVLLLLMLVVTPVLTRFNVRWWVLPCIAVGSIGTALVDYGYSFRLARHEYRAAAFVQSGTAMWRLGLIALVTTKLSAYPVSMFVAYHGASLFSGVVQSLLISQVLQRPDRALIKRLWRYSFWLGKANIVVIFSLYQGTLLLMLLNQSAAAGLYGLALTLSLGFSAISTTYSEYLLVKVRSAENLSRFIPRAVLGALILMVASAPLVVLIATVLPWFLKAELIPVIPIFICVAASMSLLILQGPLVAICHYLLRPHLITVGWVLRAVFIGVIGVILAPRMGSMGAAIAQLIGSGLALIPLTLLVATSLRSDMKLQSAEVAHASPDSISSEGVMF
jgi:O-antigen/teichoic acid export membrane protein